MTSNLDNFLTVVVCTYKRVDFLRNFLSALKCQTDQGFEIIVLHDGPDRETSSLIVEMQFLFPDRLRFIATSKRMNNYGHSLRELGLREVQTPYVLITNEDNYYAPVLVSELRSIIHRKNPKLILLNTIHSYPDVYTSAGLILLVKIWDKLAKHGFQISLFRKGPYSPLRPKPRENMVDIGSIIAHTALAQQVGFPWRNYSGDGLYCEEIAKRIKKSEMARIGKYLFIHN